MNTAFPPKSAPSYPPADDEARFFPVSRARRQEIRRRLGWRGFVVLVIGRLARNKGYDLLLPAFRRASVHAPEARLVLAIGGKSLNPEEQKILDSLKKLAAELRLGAKVQFESFIPDPDLADTYRAADTFVLCSRYEPFGMTAVEAMACGTPTIVSIHGGLARDLESGRHALHADPFNEEDLGSALRRLMVEPFLRARLSRRGARLVRSQFTWERVAQRLVKVAAGQTARGRSRRAGTDGESHGGN